MNARTLEIASRQDTLRDKRIERYVALMTPRALFDELPLTDVHAETVHQGRTQTHAVVDGHDDRLLVVVGPCSVHDPEATFDYARRLAAHAAALSGDLLVTMRVYFEKPRTTIGWKG